jgi:hypothetical protein
MNAMMISASVSTFDIFNQKHNLMTTLDVLKGIQRIMIEKLIAKSDIIISVSSRPGRSELSIYVQNTSYVVLAHEIFIDDTGIDFKEENRKAYVRIWETINKHTRISVAS